MALDAATLALTAHELAESLADARIDKIFQPTRDEVLLAMRSRTAGARLLLSARLGSARICLTEASYENPASPPSFCMLLRKYLTGGRLAAVRPVPGERIVFFDFTCTDDLGDPLPLTLAAELMGRYCNLVLVRGWPACEAAAGGAMAAGSAEDPLPAAAPAGPPFTRLGAVRGASGSAVPPSAEPAPPQDQPPPKVIDALKRVGFDDSAVRQLLPGLGYTLPPRVQGLDFITAPFDEVAGQLGRLGETPLPEALRRTLGGVGPVVLREVCWRAFGAAEKTPAALGAADWAALEGALAAVRADYAAGGKPNIVMKPDGLPAEFSFTLLTQYQPGCVLVEYPGFSALLEGYYAEKDHVERLRQKSKQLRKTVQNLYERAVRKQAARQEELAASEASEGLRQTGELLTANLHALQKGAATVRLLNWYSGKEEDIKLDPRLSPSQNAQKYYKDYKRRQTAAAMLQKLLEEGAREIEYLATVLYEVDGAEGEAALNEIRAELKAQGYLKYYKQRDKRQRPADFLRYRSADGFLILVGRNNTQNERLTLKTARGKDLWFHVKTAPGSHVVVMSEGRDIPDATRNEAAMLAVHHSSQKNGVKVPVDYTEVRNIRKTAGLPPGMVLYDHYETAAVTPDPQALTALEARTAAGGDEKGAHHGG